jgi:hypothetical protein
MEKEKKLEKRNCSKFKCLYFTFTGNISNQKKYKETPWIFFSFTSFYVRNQIFFFLSFISFSDLEFFYQSTVAEAGAAKKKNS